MKATLKTACALIGTLALFGCGNADKLGNNPDPAPTPRILEKPSLTQINSCDDFLASIKATRLKTITAQLNSYQTCPEYSYYPSMPVSTSAESTATADAVPGFTDTNTQEINVAESDIIKTNGKYIFVATNKGVDIFKAWPLLEFEKVGQFEIDGGVSHLLLSDTTLIAISSHFQNSYAYGLGEIDTTSIPSQEPIPSRVSLIDISQPDAPELIWEEVLPGSILNTRLVQNVLHVATNSSLNSSYIYSVDFTPLYNEYYSNSCQDAVLSQIAADLLADAKIQIEKLAAQDVLPQQIDCDKILMESGEGELQNDSSLTGLTSLNILNPSAFKQSFILGNSNELYVTEASAYVVGYGYDSDETHIHRFALDATNLHDYKTSTAAEGRFLNSFSFSEHENVLRVAVEGSQQQEPSSGNTLSTLTRVLLLDITKEGLPELGRVVDLGINEHLYGVRFFGERGYVVTYKKVDPLYVLDLSDPTNPVVAGELKMPGFSTYLHWLDEDHIIGLGLDAEEVSGANFSWFQGLKLATFDVSDAKKPAVANELIIGGRGTTSYALDDHHAFTFDADTGTLALPLTLSKKSSGGNTYGSFQYQGVHMYQIDAKNGITEEATVALPSSASTPKRTILVGDEQAKGLFVLDNENLYLFDANNNYDLVGTETLDHEINWYGWCGTM